MSAAAGLNVGVLGPLQVATEAGLVEIGAPKQRLLLVLLALRAGRMVGADELISGIWGDEPPRTAHKTLQTYISGLRRVLPDATLRTSSGGYQLELPVGGLDAARFESLIEAARRLRAAGDELAAVLQLDTALGLWRGPALADVADQPGAMAAARRLDELRAAAEEDRAELHLAHGAHHEIVGDLESAVTAEPLRERRWAQLMTALYRCGRQADALRAYRRLRDLLGDELGIEPSAELVQLEQMILLQQPELDWLRPPPGGPVRPATTTLGGPTTVRRSASLRASAWLEVGDGRRVPLFAPETIIGRSPDCTVVIEDGQASRRHVAIRSDENVYQLSDLDSTNGTMLNDAAVTSAPLADGDRIMIGDTEIRFYQPGTATRRREADGSS